MKNERPEKRGQYVRIEGTLYPVTGARQALRAASRLTMPMVPICYWDGSEWHDTGTVLHRTIA